MEQTKKRGKPGQNTESGQSGWFDRACHRTYAMFTSNRFFYIILGVLIFQATWLALSGRYPMAYDEQNHLGIVKLYSAHISPFWAEQPPGDAPFSAVSRDPSYLYHYIMSFAYRLFDLFWKTDSAKILAFRFMSIAMFAGGLVLYRKLLLRTRASKALVNAIFAIFVLLPTVPFLAAQMNYDNLLFPLLAGLLLLTTKIIDDIRNDRQDARKILLFFGAGMLTGLVKFPALPLLLAMGIWILVAFFRHYDKRALWSALKQLGHSFTTIRRPVQIGLVLLVLLGGLLFFERYGINTIRYGTPIPACDKVLDEQRCMAFGPWKRDYDINIAKMNGTLSPAPPSLGPVYFTIDEWFKLLIWQFFYSLNGPADGFSVGFPYPVPYYTGVIMLIAGTAAALFSWRFVTRRPYIRGLLFVALFYVVVLWVQNYSDFRQLHLATAIQARYIVQILPIVMLALALGLTNVLRKAPRLKASLVVLTLLILITQGGGIEVYILRSEVLWWWPNRVAVDVNRAAKRVLDPMVIGWAVQAPKKNY